MSSGSGFWHRVFHAIRSYYIGRRQAALLYALRFLPLALILVLAFVLNFSWTFEKLLIALGVFMILDYSVFDRLGRKVLWKVGSRNQNQRDSILHDEEELFVKQYNRLPSAEEYKNLQDKLQKRFHNNP